MTRSRLAGAALSLSVGLALALGLAPSALAGSDSAVTPIGSMAMVIDGGEFTEECTDFPYVVEVTGATSDVQWSADIEATRSGSRSKIVEGITDFGSGTFEGELTVCSGVDGPGDYTAAVAVRLWDTTDSTKVFDRTMSIDFTVSKADSVTTITGVSERSGKTKVKGTVLTTSGLSDPTKFGEVTIKVKKPGGSWKTKGTQEVNSDGKFTLTISTTYPSGTKFKAVFAGTDESSGSTSAVWTT